MKTELRTDITIKELINGFSYDKSEGKGLYGWGGRLVIQPDYQRNYLYEIQKKEIPVIDSVLKGYPLGVIYFNKRDDGLYEVLDGQQRITSIGRFAKHMFPVMVNDSPMYIDALSEEDQNMFYDTTLLIYICEGTEKEIKEWFKTINIAGVPLNAQELRNAVYSGPFVEAAKAEYSNKQNSNIAKWATYVKANEESVTRQGLLELALSWISKGDIDGYMAAHKNDTDITEMKNYWDSVFSWIDSVFPESYKEMCGLKWNELYDKYHKEPYNPTIIAERVRTLMADEMIGSKRGIFEYVLSGETRTELLQIRVFDESTKRTVYEQQTAIARERGVSNCPACAYENKANATKIWKLNEMDADHVSAWSRGGATDISNCQMLCRAHNRQKGNK